MANWDLLKASIASVIRANGNQEITGDLLQGVLNNIVSTVGQNATFGGIATPSTNPGAPDGPVYYLATSSGVYSNFGGISLALDEAVILLWNNGSWSKQTAGFATQEAVDSVIADIAQLQQVTSSDKAALTAEIQRAQTAEAALQSAIDTEKQRAEQKEDALQNDIDGNAEAIRDEVNRAKQEEAALQAITDSLGDDIEAASSDISNLEARIEAEVTRAKAAEQALSTEITDAENRVDERVTEVRDNLEAEVQARNVAVADLNANTGISEYPAFDPAVDYAVGDVVVYEGRLKRFTEDHAAGEWNGTDTESWSEKKEVNREIDMLNIEVNGVVKLDLSIYSSDAVYIDGTTQGTAKWLLNNNSYKGMLIPCKVGATYHITRNDIDYAVCAFVKKVGNNGDVVDFAYIGSGNIGRFRVENETSWNDIVAPEGSAFLWVATNSGIADRTPKEIIYTASDSIKSRVEKTENEITLLSQKIEETNNNINATDALVDEVRNDIYGTETVDGEIDLSSGVETFYIDKQLVGEAYWMNNARYKGKIFPCIVGASYHIVKQESQSAQYAFIKEVGNAGDLVNFSVEKNGYGKHVLRGTSSDDTYNDLVAEEGTKYIWVGTTSGGNDITPLQIIYHKDGIKSIKDSVTKLEEKLRPQDDSLFKSVAHRGYVGSQILSTPTANQLAPENTIPAYILARKMGYKYVETDIHFTSDNIPCLLHDTTIDRTSNGSGNLAEMTLAQAKTYDFSKLCPYMQDVKIPTLDEFLIVCRDLNLHPYLEISWYNNTYVEIIVDTVKKRHMINDVTFISTVLDTLKKVKELAPTARLGRLPQYGVTVDAVFVEETKTLQNEQNKVFIDSNTRTDDEVSACIGGEIPLEVWVVETEDALRILPDYVSGITTDVIIAGDIFKKGYGLNI